MTPWNAAIVRSAEALAALLAEPASRVDLEVAITARAAILDHIATVLGDVVPRTRTRHAAHPGHQVPVATIEADPIDGLARVLHGRRRPGLDRAPSELLDPTRTVELATERWRDAGRHILFAERAWNGPSVGALDGDRAWAVVAEVAALAEAIAILDGDLAPMASSVPEIAAAVQSTAGLRIAARETLALTGIDQNAVAERRPAAGPDAAAINAALAARSGRRQGMSREVRRLTLLLEETADLTPPQVRACARVTRDLAVLAAREAVSFTGTDLRDELGQVARELHAAARRDRGEFAINPVQARHLELGLRDLHTTTRLAFATGSGLGPEEATRVARRLPDLVETLAAKALVQVDRARWAVPDRAEGAQLRYALASSTDPAYRPPLLDALKEASAAADVLEQKVAPPLVPSPLTSALAALPRRPDRVRAAHPSAVSWASSQSISR